MIPRLVKQRRNQGWRRPAYLVIAALAALIAPGDDADARGGRSERRVESVESRIAGEPIMAIVSLQDQRITVYDANGWILRAPVSSGQRGRETPAGIFTVIQKEAEHYSNLYDDAYMPHMQRITWSGIALHGGPLPGYPASHGCVRMPFDFAERLFGDTRIGLRVIVAPADVAPIEIAHPALLKPKPDVIALAAARRAEADEATGKADQARTAAAKAYRESTQATMPVRVAENLKRRAETQLAAAEAALGSATSAESKEQAERTKAQAVTRVAELQEQWTAAKAELQPKLDAVTAAREAALAAENARIAAAEAARQAARELEPVSVLISRKTQRLYVRRAFEPILESPVTIQDADRPIGTHIFTAMEQAGGGTGIRWSVVSLESSRPPVGTVEPHDPARGHKGREVEPKKTEPGGATAALDRIVIPQDVVDRIAGVAPRSSIIITDEGLSSETGKGTDFVVLMSGEPQGGIKMRRRAPASEFPYARARDRRPFWSPPFAGPFSTW
ncbi:L,D-transpeptidase family protein [Bradyrhizobium sp. USDA 10063]